MTTPARRWARADATQQRILGAATDVFRTRGFSAATMADIVGQSGASIGSSYHHFGGKKELFLAIYDRLSATVEVRIAEGAQQAADLDSREAFAVHARAAALARADRDHLGGIVDGGDVRRRRGCRADHRRHHRVDRAATHLMIAAATSSPTHWQVFAHTIKFN
jgi:AcrR family transcriptional regulator